MTHSPQVDAMVATLRDCRTNDALDREWGKMGHAVKLMRLDPKMKVRAIHVVNAGIYQRMCIQKGWVDG